MAQRRAGHYPRAWTAGVSSPPATCTASSSTAGTYAPATAAGAPNVTALSSCTRNVLFKINATTYYGENVYLIGNVTDLGAWTLDNTPTMSGSNYTDAAPLWYVKVAMAAGETVSYGYAKHQDCDQGYLYESINRTLVVPSCVGNGTATEVLLTADDSWTGPAGKSGNCK